MSQPHSSEFGVRVVKLDCIKIVEKLLSFIEKLFRQAKDCVDINGAGSECRNKSTERYFIRGPKLVPDPQTGAP